MEKPSSPSSGSARAYRSPKRTDLAAATRRRITEAAVDLHGSVGPAYTTISGIAEAAGVTRVTVYKHFPTLEELFGACSAHWLSAHPWPDVDAWARIADPGQRLERALNELYDFFRSNEAMVANLHRDLEALPAPNQARIKARPGVMASTLMKGRRERGMARRSARALITHALEFDTWRSLTSKGLSDRETVGLLCRAVGR
jgi:AcrR family transcriptional regulator